MDKQIEQFAKRVGFRLLKKPFTRWYDPQGQESSEKEIIDMYEEIKKIKTK